MNESKDDLKTTTKLDARDGQPINVVCWLTAEPAKAAVQVAHGMGEHILRYEAAARALNAAGYVVYGNNHRGHGPDSSAALGAMGPDGWNRTLEDMHSVNAHIREQQPGLPVVLLGHSMGSMLAAQYLYRWGYTLDAAVLSGTPGFAHPLQTAIVGLLATFERWRHGQDGNSQLLQNMLFADANKPFDSPGATGYEWLSRDDEQVQRYVNDPQCGFVLSAGSMVDLTLGRFEATRKLNTRCIPKQLPLYVFSGSDDPVHNEQKNINRMLDAYRQAGVNPTVKLYPQGRHEMFNETNGDEVLEDLVTWLDQALSAPSF